MHRSRGQIRVVVLAAAGVTIAAGIVAPSGAAARGAGGSVRQSHAVVGTHYATVERACATPTRRQFACDAVRRVVVAKGTPGARPFAVKAAFPTGPSGGYTPADLATAYGFDPNGSAAGQTVGIVDAYNDPNALADLDHFDAQYGLPAETSSTFSVIGQTGSPTALPGNDTSGWSIEESLDVDAVRGVCHNCKIVLVETNSSYSNDLATGVHAAVQAGATEVSNSYGGPEYNGIDASAEESAYTYPGVVITASTGDSGWYDWDTTNEGGGSSDAPELPAALPTVVAVGGTTLNLNSDGTRSSETVWNRNGADDATGWHDQFAEGASGGGCSTVYNAPGWQHSVPGWNTTGCGGKRLNADISAIADPYTGYDIYDSYTAGGGPGGWATYGGTSLASPVIAAIWALAGGSGGVTYPALSLYGHLVSAASPFYDVTSGSNSYCDGDTATSCATKGPLAGGDGNPNHAGYGDVDCAFPSDASSAVAPLNHITQCNAATGYDGPSGVGTPNGLTGFQAMSPSATLTLPSQLVLNSSASFGAAATDPFPGGHIVSYGWIFGDGSARDTTATDTDSHTYTTAGHYTVRLIPRDNYGRITTVISHVVVGIVPTAAITGPSTTTVGTPTQFSGTGSTDPNTGGSITSYAWTWGSGPGSTGPTPTHTFTTPGTHNVRLTVTDNAGLSRSKVLVVTVS